MKRKIQVTRDQLDKLIADIHALPDEPVGDHLPDDEFIGYTMEALVQEEVVRIDAHLASCPDCASEMERLMEASEIWRGEQGEQRLAELAARTLAAMGEPHREPLRRDPNKEVQRAATEVMGHLGHPSELLERLAARLARVLFTIEKPQFAGVHAKTPHAPRGGQTEDGLLRWRAVADETGNIIIRFASHEAEFAGVRLRLRAGMWQREVVLTQKGPDQVGAEIALARDELPAETVWRVELVDEDPKKAG
jgi:hypothetical protein